MKNNKEKEGRKPTSFKKKITSND